GANGDLLLHADDLDLALFGEVDVQGLARRRIPEDLRGANLEELTHGHPLARAAVDVDLGPLHQDHVSAPVQVRDLGDDEGDRLVDRLLDRGSDVRLLEPPQVAAHVPPLLFAAAITFLDATTCPVVESTT